MTSGFAHTFRVLVYSALVPILFVGCDTGTPVQESQPNPYKVDQQFEKAMNEAYRGVTRRGYLI